MGRVAATSAVYTTRTCGRCSKTASACTEGRVGMGEKISAYKEACHSVSVFCYSYGGLHSTQNEIEVLLMQFHH